MGDMDTMFEDIGYLMAMDENTPLSERVERKIQLPPPSIRSLMQKYMLQHDEMSFEKIFYQKIGFLLLSDFCLNVCSPPVLQIKFYDEIKKYELIDSVEERINSATEMYEKYFATNLLLQSNGVISGKASPDIQAVLSNAQKTGQISTQLFSPYLEELAQFLKENIFEKFLDSDKFTRFCQWKNIEFNMNLTPDDFIVHRLLGRGGFGAVSGVRKADTAKMYAMKCMEKKRVKAKKGEKLTMNELEMLLMVSLGGDAGCPFIVCMTYSFQTTDCLYFILDLMNGGDLQYHLKQHGPFCEEDVRFYAAEIILGLDHMHSRSIVYRDLKPANILLDDKGHVRISDLGLAIDFSVEKPSFSIGTYGYMAPELLNPDEPYDSSVDWFALGCTIYMLLKNKSPFKHIKPKDRRHLELESNLNMEFDLEEPLSAEMRSLVSDLLEVDYTFRLGCGPGRTEDVKNHVYFKGTDWQKVYLLGLTPPLVPERGTVNAANPADIGSFENQDHKQRITEADQELYKDFTVTLYERWQREVVNSVFDMVNEEHDKLEKKLNLKPRLDDPVSVDTTDCIVEGEAQKLGGPFMQTWQKRYLKLYPNRLELYAKSKDGHVIQGKGAECIPLMDIREIVTELQKINKMQYCLIFSLKNNTKVVISSPDRILMNQWKMELMNAYQLSVQMFARLHRKARKKFGAESNDSLKKNRIDTNR